MENPGFFPGVGRIVIDLFGGEGVFAVIARAGLGATKTEPQVFAGAGEQGGALEGLPEGRLVAEGAIAHGDEAPGAKAVGVQAGAQFAHHGHKGRRKVVGLLGLAVGGPLLRAGLFGRFTHGRDFFKAHRQRTRGTLGIQVVEGQQQRGLQEALAP
jgi:hypothetical protein